MNITMPRGANLMLDFALPFTDPPAPTVHLDLNGEELLFLRDGMAVASFTRVTDPDQMVLLYMDGGWYVRFSSSALDFLLDGQNEYEFTANNMENQPIVEVAGVVNIDG